MSDGPPGDREDLAAVVALEAENLGADAWSENLLAEGLAGRLPTIHYLVAEVDGAVVGHAVTSLAGDIAELQRIAVTPAARRTGVASGLLEAVIELAGRSDEADRMLLEVRADNAGALAFYAARGFVEVDRRPKYYRDGSTAVVMRLPLGPGLRGRIVTMSEPLVLGIETSCDETGVGIVRGHTLLADAVASSVDEHARFGGVVPEVASRAHLEAMVPTIERACETAGIAPYDVDAIAVTSGPGLAGALLVGVAAAKALAIGLGKPLYGVNHLASHVAVDQLEHGPLPEPVLAMLVSGGHSSACCGSTDVTTGVKPLGATIDDAAGEAFDKVARLLGLPFPGGPHIDREARSGSSVAIDFPRGLTSRRDLERHRFDFSFSGLKTAVARWVEARERSGEPVPVADVAASFQEAVCDVLVRKALDAATVRGHRRPAHRRRRRGQLPAPGHGRDPRRRPRHPGPGAAARALHRQRRHGRRARRRDGRPRAYAVLPGPAGRLQPAGDHRPGLRAACTPVGR